MLVITFATKECQKAPFPGPHESC